MGKIQKEKKFERKADKKTASYSLLVNMQGIGFSMGNAEMDAHLMMNVPDTQK